MNAKLVIDYILQGILCVSVCVFVDVSEHCKYK